MNKLGIRWTVGNVSPAGRLALRLSVLGAYKVFGNAAEYAISVNSTSIDQIRAAVDPLPVAVRWIQSKNVPEPFLRHCDGNLAEGVAWKFSPVRVFADRHELALDNDCIIWKLPEAVDRWVRDQDSFLIAEDVAPAFGIFAEWLGKQRFNSGIRGLPPHFDFGQKLLRVLDETGAKLNSELDEQGLQVAATTQSGRYEVVSIKDVSICSPFPPHTSAMGQCGAHFVGLNSHTIPWDFYGRPAAEVRLEHFFKHVQTIVREVGEILAELPEPE